MKTQEFVGSFQAVSSSGTVFTINVFQDYTIEITRDRRTHKLPGHKELRTDSGRFVNADPDDENVFYIEGLIKVTRLS